ncbi:MAG TPA: protein kinase [Planctomycetota bacterium]
MSGNASSADDELAGRVFDDLHEHERSRESTEVAGDDVLLGQIALEWKLVDRPTLDGLRAAGGRLEELLVARGILKREDVDALLKEKKLRVEGRPEIPRYEIRERIGEGATAVVYAAWDRQLRRDVALKVLRERALLGETAELRFRREARAAAALTHPNLVAVYDAGEAGGRLYIVMELVAGRSLKGLIRDPGAPRILEKAARGVAAAHEKGIVHRDLKPANILVGAGGEPKVGDFGLAHLLDSESEVTATGVALGTPLYMSPEQVRGDSARISPRTDVYALGAILYEALSGAPPHPGDAVPEIYRKILEEAPADVPGPLGTIALKALEKDPARRYPGAAAFADDLRRALDGEPILARRPGRVDRLLRRARRNAAALAVWTAVALGLLGVWIASARLRAERDASVAMLRETARLSLEAALQRREKGENAEMRRYLPALEQAYEGARARGARSAEIEYLMGRMHRALMDNEKALAFQAEALRADPGYGPALYERAVLRLRTGAPDAEILDDLRRFLALPRDWPAKDVRLSVARGLLAHLEGRPEEARELLESAARQDPLLDEAWDALARVAATARGDREKDWLEREKALTEAIRADRGYLPHLLGRGDLKRNRGNERANRGENPLPDYQAAEEDYGEALRLNAESQEGWLRRATVRTLRANHRAIRDQDPLPDYAAAETDLDALAKLAPAFESPPIWRSVVRVCRGSFLASRGRDPLPEFTRAVEDASAAIALHPPTKEAHKRRGIAYVERATHLLALGRDASEDLKRAAADLREAALRLPESSEVRLWLGILAFRSNDPAAAAEVAKAVEMTPSYARAWMWRGLLKSDVADLDRALELNRGLPEAWLWRGVLNARRGAPAEAEADLSQALKLDPGYADARVERGLLRLRRRDFQAAADDLEAALRINPALRERVGPKLDEAKRR